LRVRENGLAFLGQGLLGIDDQGRLLYHDLQNGSTHVLAEGMDSLFAVSVPNPDSTACMVVSGDRLPSQQILLIRATCGLPSCTILPVQDSPVTSACVNCESTRALLTTRSRNLLLYDIQTATLIRSVACKSASGLPIRGTVNTCRLACWQGRDYAIVATAAGEACVWICDTDQVIKRGLYTNIRRPTELHDIDIDTGNGQIFTVTDDQIQAISLDGSEPLGKFTTIAQCALLEDGTLLTIDRGSNSLVWHSQGKQLNEFSAPKLEPVSVCSFSKAAVVGYSNGMVAKHQADTVPDTEDTLDLFDHAVVSVIALEGDRVLASSAQGEFRICRFQPSDVLRSIPPVSVREEHFIRRLGQGDDFLCCGTELTGTVTSTVHVVYANGSTEQVLRSTAGTIRDAVADRDGRKLFIVFKDAIRCYRHETSGWIVTGERIGKISHIAMLDDGHLAIVLKDGGVSWVELMDNSLQIKGMAIAAEVPFECSCIATKNEKIGLGGYNGMHSIFEIRRGEQDDILQTESGRQT